ncbi:hypothetical protein GGR56DRAFT_176513 [Xylariaceae sp. FL0804]|nr:hypothetical protein GGR56DRAFT_176513 [Xylariaceae sp. FL0804]
MAPWNNIFLRLPPATAALLLSAAFGLSSGHALPRQTKTVAYYELDVVPFPPAPTAAPFSPFELLRRQENTVCGYIGGNSDLPATCSAGSHCALDSSNGVVGCCPNGAPCTAGIFTGCVDVNSPPQTEINPYVFTCAGSEVCFQNQFAGGYSQFGCGTASDLGTTVETSVQGVPTLSLEQTNVEPTATPSTLSEPTTIVSRTSTPSSSSTTSTTSSTTSTSSSSSSTDPASSSSATTPMEAATSSASATSAPTTAASTSRNNTGAIVGGVVGGAVALVAIVGLAAFCLRKRASKRKGSGPGSGPAAARNTEYQSPMKSHGAAFAPLPSWNDDESDGYGTPPMAHSQYQQQSPYRDVGWEHPLMAGMTTTATGPSSPPRQHRLSPRGHHSRSFSQPLRSYAPAHVPGMGTGLAPVVEEEQQQQHPALRPSPGPAAREIDEFSRAYASAGIGGGRDSHSLHDNETDAEEEDDRRPLRTSAQEQAGSSTTPASDGGGSSENRSSSRSRGSRPLWQQNRTQHRNMMWL